MPKIFLGLTVRICSPMWQEWYSITGNKLDVFVCSEVQDTSALLPCKIKTTGQIQFEARNQAVNLLFLQFGLVDICWNSATNTDVNKKRQDSACVISFCQRLCLFHCCTMYQIDSCLITRDWTFREMPIFFLASLSCLFALWAGIMG